MPRRRVHAPGPATEVQAPMQAKGNARPRRRPVARHPGIYYRPRPGGKVAPPYEISYLDSTGRRRWMVVQGSLDDAEAKRAELRLRRRRGERIAPVRKSFEEYAWEWLERQPVRERTREVHSWALREHLIPYFGRRRLGHRKPDTTLRVYAHQWKEREARRSQVGRQLGQLFEERRQLPAPAPSETRLALPPASAGHHDRRRSSDRS